MKNLIYTNCTDNYKEVLNLWANSLNHYNNIDLLVLCPENFECDSRFLKHPIKNFNHSYTGRFFIHEYEKINDYDNILYLDLDILCLKPLEELFKTIDRNKDIIHGVKEGEYLKYTGPFHRFMNVDQNSISEKIHAYNSGTFGFNRNMLSVFPEFIKFVEKELETNSHDPFFSDQPFFNMFFANKELLKPTLWEYVFLIDFGINAHPVEECNLIHFVGSYGDPNYKLNLMRDYKYC
jgi:lipopolysaccharide biosynthesis glycosyltransferase